MGVVSGFKEFAVKGYMSDMAVGIIMGRIFGSVITFLLQYDHPVSGHRGSSLDFSNKKNHFI